MSVKHRKERHVGEPGSPEHLQQIERNIAKLEHAGEQTASVLSMLFQAQVTADRESGMSIITDDMILQVADVLHFPEWIKNTEYRKGDILELDGKLGESVDAHKSAVSIEDDMEHFRLIGVEETPKKKGKKKVEEPTEEPID